MKCKALAIIVLLLVFGAMLQVSCTGDKSIASDPFDAIPEGSSIIVSTSNIDSVSSLFSCNNSLMQIFYSPKSDIRMPICGVIDSLVKCGMFGNHLEDEAVLSVRKDGNSGLCQLYVRKTDLCDKDAIASLTDSIKRIGSVESRIFNDVEILKIKLSSDGVYLSVGFVNGLVLLSSSARYLEDAMQCYSGSVKRLKDDECFAKAFASSGKKELASLFMNARSTTGIFSSELFDDHIFVKNVDAIDGWFSFDIVGKSSLSLNGIEYPVSDTSSFASFLKSLPSVEFNSTSVIPESSAAYILVSFADAQKYEEALSAYMASTGALKFREKSIKEMNDAFGFDAKTKFYSMVKHEFAYVVSKNSNSPEEGALVVCGLQSQSAAELELRNMVSDANVLPLEEGSSTNVFKMPCDDIPSVLFGDLFTYCHGSYVCCISNFLVFANSVEDLRSLSRAVSLNNTMKASISHREFLSKFSTSSSMLLYYSFAGGTEIMKRMVSQQYSSDIDRKSAEIAANGAVGIQFKHLDGIIYCNVSFGETDAKPLAGSATIWETNIGASVATKPFIVKNHDTGGKEIILQDVNNVLYLLDFSGKEIWHIQIDDKITSPISQVDAYRNGKLQYLFSTRNKIYMVDRIGNFVSKFPITLRADATAPISVFDYEGNRSYRIFAPCSDNNVYVYDIEGNLLKGWNFAGTETNVSAEVAHYVVSKEDFIVFHDEYRAYFLARNGSSKMEFLTGFKFSGNAICCDEGVSPKFVATDVNGIVRRFFKNGHQDSIKVGDFSENHYFVMKDIDSDGRQEYVFADSSKLSVYANGGKLLFEHDFGAAVSRPAFYQYGGQVRIGVTTANGKMYLVNANGTIAEGFPLDGQTPFSICEVDAENGTYGLVAGLKNGRLINYRIIK